MKKEIIAKVILAIMFMMAFVTLIFAEMGVASAFHYTVNGISYADYEVMLMAKYPVVTAFEVIMLIGGSCYLSNLYFKGIIKTKLNNI